jgi:hypothetical protein
MPIGHISIPTGSSNFLEMRDFYLAILKPLGYVIYKEDPPNWCGMGPPNCGPDMWLHGGAKDSVPGNLHIAFQANSRRVVDEWYKNAM